MTGNKYSLILKTFFGISKGMVCLEKGIAVIYDTNYDKNQAKYECVQSYP